MIFEVQLSEQDIALYTGISQAAQAEAEAWLKVRESLRDYIVNHMDVDNESDIENLHGMFLPDLVDEIVEELSAGEEDA